MQFYVHKAREEITCFNYESWEIPQGGAAQTFIGEDAVLAQAELSKQAYRIFGRFVWSQQAPDHINPGAGGDVIPGLRLLVAKLSFDPILFPNFETSSFLRVAAWSSEARRRELANP